MSKKDLALNVALAIGIVLQIIAMIVLVKL